MRSSPTVSAPADATALTALRITFVVVPFLAGLDKFFGLLADWSAYLSPLLRDHIPMSPAAFLGFAGVVEMAVGVLMATRYVRVAAYLACAWLVLIALQLLAARHIDVAVRDLAMAVAAFTLARLSPATALVGHARQPSQVTA